MEARETPDHEVAVATGLQPIHDRAPNFLRRDGHETAAHLATQVLAAGPGAFPFFTAFSMLFQAQSHALAGRGRQALIDMGTAVEALVTELIASALLVSGNSPDEIEKVLGKRWRDLYNRELLDVLGIPLDRGGPVHSRWWSTHYPMRVAVVHRGERVTQRQATDAISDSWELFDWIGDCARAKSGLGEIGNAIRVQRSDPTS